MYVAILPIALCSSRPISDRPSMTLKRNSLPFLTMSLFSILNDRFVCSESVTMSFSRLASLSRSPVTSWPGAAPVPILKISRSAFGQMSLDSTLAVRTGLLLPVNAPSTNLCRLGPISMGSKKVLAAEVALAASHILQMSYSGSWPMLIHH